MNQEAPLASAEAPKELTAKEQQAVQKEQQALIREREHQLKTEIAALTPQVKWMQLRADLAKHTYDHYRYSLELNKIQNGINEEAAKVPAVPAPIDHVVTAEDLVNNPDLVAADVKVGDTIQINPKDIVAPLPQVSREFTAEELKNSTGLLAQGVQVGDKAHEVAAFEGTGND